MVGALDIFVEQDGNYYTLLSNHIKASVVTDSEIKCGHCYRVEVEGYMFRSLHTLSKGHNVPPFNTSTLYRNDS